MKYLKTQLKDLQKLIKDRISVLYIYEKLDSFDYQKSTLEVKQYMESKDFEVIGVKEKNIIKGYALQSEIGEGLIGNYKKPFPFTISNIAPISEAFKLLKKNKQVFVKDAHENYGIITKGDLQKIPVRMWLFALVSILEMQFLRIIRTKFPNNSWKNNLGAQRLKAVYKIQASRKRHDIAIELDECLQLCDKRDLIAKNIQIFGDFKASKNKFRKNLEDIENLMRNPLAHSLDITSTGWPKIADLTDYIEKLILKCEKVS